MVRKVTSDEARFKEKAMTGQERPNSHQNEIFWVSTKTLPVLFFILLKYGSINSLVTVCKIYMSGKNPMLWSKNL